MLCFPLAQGFDTNSQRKVALVNFFMHTNHLHQIKYIWDVARIVTFASFNSLILKFTHSLTTSKMQTDTTNDHVCNLNTNRNRNSVTYMWTNCWITYQSMSSFHSNSILIDTWDIAKMLHVFMQMHDGLWCKCQVKTVCKMSNCLQIPII